jgi:hypothetical protein
MAVLCFFAGWLDMLLAGLSGYAEAWLCWLLVLLVGWLCSLADYSVWLSSLDLMSG